MNLLRAKKRFISLIMSVIMIIGVFATSPLSVNAVSTRYEAEDAVLSNPSNNAGTVETLTDASGGKFARMRESNLTFTVNVPTAGNYCVNVCYSLGEAGSKVQDVVVNGSAVGDATFGSTALSGVTFATIPLLLKVSLNAGDNTIEIRKSWGWIDVDYIEVDEFVSTPFNVASAPINPDASANTKKLYSFIKENFQNKIISGVMTNEVTDGNNPLTAVESQKEVAHIKTSSGKSPALVGFDFMHGTGKNSDGIWYQGYTDGTINLAKDLYNKGGIPSFMWHWKDPRKKDEAFYAYDTDYPIDKKTDFDLAAALADKNGADYNAIIQDIDTVAGYLKQLADDDIPVLWRPLHEAEGTWFWWGAKGAAANKELWILMYDRLVNHHGLNNLIWVWTSGAGTTALDWYPGDQYVDIVGLDHYHHNDSYNHSSLVASFEGLKGIYNAKKIVTLSENGAVPYPENLVADEAGWSWFMTWNSEYTFSSNHNTPQDWNKIMNDDYVLALEDMPGWYNYNPGGQDPDPEKDKLGDVDGNAEITINDAMEVLMYLAKMPNSLIIQGGETSKAHKAACITLTSKKLNKPSISDAMQILMYLSGIDCELN